MKYPIKTLALAAMTALVACQHQPTSPDNGRTYIPIKEYYYPLDSLQEGWVYEYTNRENGNRQYWYLKVVPDENDVRHLVTTIYTGAYHQESISREWIIQEGCVLKDNRFFQLDSAAGKMVQVEAAVKQNVIFPFKGYVSDSISYRYHIEYGALPDTNYRIRFIRDRYFKGLGKKMIGGKEYEVAMFENLCHYRVANEKAGGLWQYDSLPEQEWYAKGIGLVYQSRNNAKMNRPDERWELTNRYTMQDLGEMARQNAEKQGQ
jgi:hypothetical protein